MMKLLLLLLFCTLCSVQPSLTRQTITALSGKILYYENSTSTFICKKPHAIWKINSRKVSECNCPGKCGDIRFYKNRITTYCNGSRPVLHYKQMKLDDNQNVLKCSNESSQYLQLFVGRRSDDFYPKEPFALVNSNYTLVCEKKKSRFVALYNDQKHIGQLGQPFTRVHDGDKKNFIIKSDQSKITIIIKKVALKDDGKIFGCYPTSYNLYLLKLTVNVPVTSVSLHQQNKVVNIEDEYGIFVCKVDESKPKADFQWILSENGSEKKITQIIQSKLNGKIWQTTSTLKLKLKRSYEIIKCRARIQRMAWTNSTSLPLDIKYPPPGKPVITVNNPNVCVGEKILITCEWRGGHPSASVTLFCLSKTKTDEDYVMIAETVSREMSNHCRCKGKHVAKNELAMYDISIQYPPNKVLINETSYLKGNTSSLICDASGGNPAVYNYSWSPGNYSFRKEIDINLNQVSDPQLTCTVAHKCGESSTIRFLGEVIEESDDNVCVILSSAIAGLIFIISVVINFFIYRSYSNQKPNNNNYIVNNNSANVKTKTAKENIPLSTEPKLEKKKVAKKYPPVPTKPTLDEPTNDDYESLE